ncbi:hypothetical protein SAMN05421813_13226 [Daejeonella rubra]|uniref:Uncharacterized protein n=1 Tax=Daejeonella rubra TaxID=990371 RepID=A0A1G9XU05_9SPHI|nr:hypothetical protein SAMN05421813_13226 [Daejeonella rubra]
MQFWLPLSLLQRNNSFLLKNSILISYGQDFFLPHAEGINNRIRFKFADLSTDLSVRHFIFKTKYASHVRDDDNSCSIFDL